MRTVVSDCKWVLGIDPSLTSLAVVRFSPAPPDGDPGEGLVRNVHRFSSKPQGGTVAARMARYRDLARLVAGLVAENLRTVVCIEGYSYGSHGASVVTLGEFGGLLRMALVDAGAACVAEVAPATLKKFTIGKGSGDKSEMRLWAYKRWGVEFRTDDEVDAYALGRMGCCLAGWEAPRTRAQEESVATVLGQFES